MRKQKPIESLATCGSVHFSGHKPGHKAPFMFTGGVGDADGNLIHGTIRMTRFFAVQDAIYVLTAASAFAGGLTEEERAKLQDLAESVPLR